MSLTIYRELVQGTPEWYSARCGVLTASVIGQLLTTEKPSAIEVACPRCSAEAGAQCWSLSSGTPKPIKTIHPERTEAVATSGLPDRIVPATGDTARSLTTSLVAERVTGHVEVIPPTRAMERGHMEEPLARDLYAKHYGVTVEEVGFMVRIIDGFRLGYSPDGVIGDEGLIESKSRGQRRQLQTLLAGEAPGEHMAQMQCGLFVSGYEWADYLSYSNGMPMYRTRVYPDPEWFGAIRAALKKFETDAADMCARYADAIDGLPVADRIDYDEEITF